MAFAPLGMLFWCAIFLEVEPKFTQAGIIILIVLYCVLLMMAPIVY